MRPYIELIVINSSYNKPMHHKEKNGSFHINTFDYSVSILGGFWISPSDNIGIEPVHNTGIDFALFRTRNNYQGAENNLFY